MRKILFLLAFCVLSMPTLNAQKLRKSNLKILFVGYDPQRPMPKIEEGRMGPGMMSAEGFAKEYPVRMPAFQKLLSKYFDKVQTFDVRDWKSSDSDNFDVTIFDFPTIPTKPMVNEIGADGKRVYKAAEYLPPNFSKPVVFISGTADQMGRSIGLKLDWLCLCLDADAHHVKSGHAIFKGPLENVTLTLVDKPTPDGIFHYASGKNIAKKLPMWRVDKEGYLDNTNARIGLVARGNRFSESPDTEMISSGVCQKDVGAIALGRHGNFFLWGFGASPEGMTAEGQKVFVNAVAYMAQFNGRTPVARKYNDRMATTDDVKEIVLGVSKENYDDYVKMSGDMNERNLEMKRKLEDKKASGEKLTSQEEQSLQFAGMSQKIESWESFLKQRMGKWYNQFGEDVEGYRKYMLSNMGYVYCDPTAFFTYDIDEDVKMLGISNHDVKLLETCIHMLQKKDREDLASRILHRYTGENFQSVEEWRNWFNKNKSKLFFSETDGYRFHIDTYTLR